MFELFDGKNYSIYDENLNENSTLEEYKTVFLMNYMNESDFIAQTIEELRRENLIVN